LKRSCLRAAGHNSSVFRGAEVLWTTRRTFPLHVQRSWWTDQTIVALKLAKNERRSPPLRPREIETENLGERDFAPSKARVFSAYLNISPPEVSNVSTFPFPILLVSHRKQTSLAAQDIGAQPAIATQSSTGIWLSGKGLLQGIPRTELQVVGVVHAKR
jgi:hypothetical protein